MSRGRFDPSGKPFFLSDEDLQWVRAAFSSLDVRGKAGQLMLPMVQNADATLRDTILEEIRPGGMMLRPGPKGEMREVHADWQGRSAVPLLIPANLEAGGSGVASDGTVFSYPMGAAATGDPSVAYRLGLVCGREARAVGCNWAFAPVVDIDVNFRNPITNVRTFGSDPATVLRMAREYVRGLRESGVGETVKHWPGDGVDDRDQHLVMTRNTLSYRAWMRAYGSVYRGMIDAGARTVMCAHIAFPAWMRRVHPGMGDVDMLPATLTPELIAGLLRGALGFKGLVVSDATCMLGLTAKARRSELVPRVIASGCDVFLFNQDVMEDWRFLLDGIRGGTITADRLDEAVMRVLCFKAALGLHTQKEVGTLVPPPDALATVGCAEHGEWARDCADRAITLVKDTQCLLPLSPDKHRRVLLFGFGRPNYIVGDVSKPITADFERMLREAGFEVTVFEASTMGHQLFFSSVQRFRDSYDLAIYFAVVPPYSNAGSLRLAWVPPLGFDTPWFLHERPVMFISCANPYHLYDVPDMRTLINCYSHSPTVLRELMDKLLGRSPFKGRSPVDPFCGLGEGRG
jgi:beta-N-acetylhexosaminidase